MRGRLYLQVIEVGSKAQSSILADIGEVDSLDNLTTANS